MEQGPTIDFRNYAGPVARAYELSTAPVSVIVGPTGGGKSQASGRRILRAALKQHRSPKDGARKARIVVVCPTYRRAWDTVIPSYLKVWPEAHFGKLKGGRGDPADHVIKIQRDASQGDLHIEVLFRAVRDESLEEFVRGFETTAWWFPEMDTMPAEDLLSLASNRVGRYPEPDDRPELGPGEDPAYAGVWGDANAPVIGNWFHRRFYLERELHKATDRMFRQPDAFSGNAENMHNLRKIRPDYYAHLAASMTDYDVGRLLRCKPGWSRDGKPVHETFDDDTMVAKASLRPDPGLPVVIGVDAGNTLMPGAVFGQRSFGSEQRILAEVAPKKTQMDLVELALEIRRVWETVFVPAGCREVMMFVDPSAAAKVSTQRQISYAQLLQGESGIEVRLAPSNDPGVRRTAVERVLKRRQGMGLMIDPSCAGLIEALAGGYRFRKNGNVYSPIPEKNEHSHIADALQYYVLGAEGVGSSAVGLIPPQGAHTETERAILGD